MILDLYFATPQLLYAIPVLLVLGAIFTKFRATNKLLSASRIVVLCLIIAAAANPYFVQTHTIQSQKPSITILDDKGGLVRNLKGSKGKGLNRIWWNLRYEKNKDPKLRTTPLFADWVPVLTGELTFAKRSPAVAVGRSAYADAVH